MKGIYYLLFVITLFIAGCSASHQLYIVRDVPYVKERDVTKGPVPIEFLGKNRQLQTLNMGSQAFNTVGDWFDNENILYFVDESGGSDLYKYNIYTGKSVLFYHSASPILSIRANDDHSLFLIHKTMENNIAELTIVDKNGEIKLDWSIESFELSYVWNPFNNSQLYIANFLEDWTYQSYIMSTENKQIEKFDVANPFIQWFDHENIAYIKWNELDPSYTSPLYRWHFSTNKEKLLNEKIVSFAIYGNVLLALKEESEQSANGIYQFYDKESMEKLHVFKSPLLTNYSSYYVPYHDFVEKQQEFYTFIPYENGSFDTYEKQFDLVSISLKSGEQKSIVKGLSSMPINFSPNGKLCLYGYQYENIIDIFDKQVIQIIEF